MKELMDWTAVASLVLAAVAIYLSTLFYRLGSEVNRQALDALGEIRGLVREVSRTQYELVRESVREAIRIKSGTGFRAMALDEKEGDDDLESLVQEVFKRIRAGI